VIVTDDANRKASLGGWLFGIEADSFKALGEIFDARRDDHRGAVAGVDEQVLSA
jgi:hypothetical protein